MLRLPLLCLTVALVLSASGLDAQQGPPVPAGPRTLSGIVTDTLGNPLEDVSVFVSELRRTGRTRTGGRFRFDSVPEGRYTVGARGIGYISGTKRVVVGGNGGVVTLEMIRLVERLPAMVSQAERGGLSGVIGDTSYAALPGVRVRVIGSGETALTDSAGAFFLPVRPGHYLVYLERDGYERQRIGVTVPEVLGRKISAWLLPEAKRTNLRELGNLMDLQQRVNRASPVRTKYLTREDLLKLDLPDAAHAVANFAATPVSYSDCALLDGGPDWAPLWTIPATHIEFMEVVLEKPPRRIVTSIRNGKVVESGVGGGGITCKHIVWLRR